MTRQDAPTVELVYLHNCTACIISRVKILTNYYYYLLCATALKAKLQLCQILNAVLPARTTIPPKG